MRLSVKVACICMVCVVLALSTAAVCAVPTVSLSWYKNNGYGFGNDIGGQWTITAAVSSDVTHVEFYLDDQLQQNDTSAPFSWAFNTGNYSLGTHTIKAVAYNAEGQTATVQADRNFVEYSTNLFGVIIGVIVAVLAVSVVVAVYRIKKASKKTGS